MFESTQKAVHSLAEQIEARASKTPDPFLIAIDGRSGVGKSSLAKGLADKLAATCIEGDDFYAGGVGLRADPFEQRAAQCVDWPRLRTVLEPLKQGRAAEFHPFDWEAFDGSLAADAIKVTPRKFIVLEGVYSARPELADLVDFAVLIRLPEAERMRRLLAREGEITDWERQWHQAEDWYFDSLADDAGLMGPDPKAFCMPQALGYGHRVGK